MAGYEFANPRFLYLLILLIPYIVWYVLKQNTIHSSLLFSNSNSIKSAGGSYKIYLNHFPFILRNLALILLIVALARPQSTNKWKDEITKGIDIVIALDISSSMLAEDFRPNRMEAAKDVAVEFISGRRNDRIGLVTFSAESFTQCPITTDHAVLINLFKDIKSGMLEDGTAIGMGLANSISRLKESKAISKVVILLTDGENNRGEISPITAAEIAQAFGVRVYTIGVGTIGTAPYPFKTAFGVQYQDVEVKIDEDVLRQIAQLTGGKYFRATNNTKLKQIYQEIDKLEKSRVDVKKYSQKVDEFFWFVLIAAILLFLEILVKNTILKKIP